MTEKSISAAIVEAAKIIAESMDDRTEEIRKIRILLCGNDPNEDFDESYLSDGIIETGMRNIAHEIGAIANNMTTSEVGRALEGLSGISSNDGIAEAINDLVFVIKKGYSHEEDQN